MSDTAVASDTDAETKAQADKDGRIVCQIDNALVHSIPNYLKEKHPDWTVQRYQKEFPDAPLFSKLALKIIEEKKAAKKAGAAQLAVQQVKKGYLHEIFGFGNNPAALSVTGQPIEVTIFDSHDEVSRPYLADVDPNYVFQIDLLKKALAALEFNMPAYFWGYHGTGKTSVWEQVHARTGRPFCRVQHTINTEEAHIVGQYVVRSRPVAVEEIAADGTKHTVLKQQSVTEFQPGPLMMAMMHGWTYCADEYDFAMPSVTAVYQSVLEGKPLVVKEAPPEYRVIRPHPNFRFVATGNTNGIGDETGLYQGTLMGNAANYSRFAITEEVEYMDPKVEELVVMSQAEIDKQDAAKIVKFANQVRQAFKDGKISMTISPRELINASKQAMIFGANWRLGIRLAYANRLSRVDKQVVDEFAQRIWG